MGGAPWSFTEYVQIGFTPCCVLAGQQQIDGLVQDCSNSSTLAMELLRSWAKPSRWSATIVFIYCWARYQPMREYVNSLSPVKCGYDLECVNYEHNLGIYILSNQVNITLEWMPEDVVDNKSTSVPVIAWCREATSHYMNEFWLRTSKPYDVTRAQSVKCATPTLSG